MTIRRYRLPNGRIPVLLSSDIPELLPAEAAALLRYAAGHADIAPDAIADMLFRTRMARKHRALAMVTSRDELLSTLQAVVDGREHPAVVRTRTAATSRRPAYVFPGQGSQRPGMGRLFYESIPAFRAEADRCADAFQTQLGASPLTYLLNEHLSTQDNAGIVQPALFTQMAGLAAVWRSFGIAPKVTIGHSQGEIAAAYVSGLITLADAARLIGIRARAADEIASGDYAMAVVAADRDTCEDLLARSTGWAELSVVNSPHVTGISGDREAVQDIVDTLNGRGTFARVIAVQYPAHTSLINQLGEKVRTATRQELACLKFLETETGCVGAALGAAITSDLPVDQYWFWNLRNTVRFDKATAAALSLGIDTFVELAEHPMLQLAIQDNLAAFDGDDRSTIVVGTSTRTAVDLDDLTHNFAQLAVHDLEYGWEHLCTESDSSVPLPLPDFPNTVMSQTTLWLPYDHGLPQPSGTTLTEKAHAITEPTPARLLAEDWVRLSRRSLVSPRTIGFIDCTAAGAELADALCTAAADIGATARVIDMAESPYSRSDLNTLVILLRQSPQLDDGAAAAEVARFFGNRAWWPTLPGTVTDCWLVTVAGEAVVADDPPPDLVHAAASAGFRSVGAQYLGVRFRHLDLPAESGPQAAPAILAALHTGDEAELALRSGGLYAKRIVEGDGCLTDSAATTPGHVLIIGGTGNLGLEFCDHFACSGAQQITLVCRSGETATVADRLRRIRAATSAQIEVARCDVADHAAVALLAQQYRDRPADLIIHAAVRYSGIELEDITPELVDEALRPKVVGIWRVLAVFPRADDCRVLLCSSISATVGGRGVIVYAAANRMLDAMAHRLRSEGVNCVSVQWGHWDVHADVGRSAMSALAGTGVVAMRPADALAVGMTTPLRSNAIVATFNLARARSVLETCGRGSLLAQLSSTAVKAQRHDEQTSLSHRFIRLLAEAIGVDRADTIDTTVPMVAIGLDSLQALELRRRVQLEFNYDLEVADLLGGASIADVVAKLGA